MEPKKRTSGSPPGKMYLLTKALEHIGYRLNIMYISMTVVFWCGWEQRKRDLVILSFF